MAQRDRSQLSPKVLRSALRPRSQGKWGWGHLEATKGLQGAFRVSGEAYRRGLTTAAREEPRGLFPVSLAEVGEEGRVEGERSWENRLLCQPPTLKGVPCCEVRERDSGAYLAWPSPCSRGSQTEGMWNFRLQKPLLLLEIILVRKARPARLALPKNLESGRP